MIFLVIFLNNLTFHFPYNFTYHKSLVLTHILQPQTLYNYWTEHMFLVDF